MKLVRITVITENLIGNLLLNHIPEKDLGMTISYKMIR